MYLSIMNGHIISITFKGNVFNYLTIFHMNFFCKWECVDYFEGFKQMKYWEIQHYVWSYFCQHLLGIEKVIFHYSIDYDFF
jgi:hypothetical protein